MHMVEKSLILALNERPMRKDDDGIMLSGCCFKQGQEIKSEFL